MSDALVLAAPKRAVAPPSATRCWLAVLLLCAGQFMDVLDFSIVNIALPTIGRDLRFSPTALPWVVNAYALSLGGFLLLGGAVADLIGRRRAFMAGLGLATLAALAGGLATAPAMLVAARAVQGLGIALLSPAALALIATAMPTEPERTRALGIWGGVAAAGMAAGILLGGLLTAAFGWRAVLLVNVPLGLAAFALAPVLLAADRPALPARPDLRGALLVTGGLVALMATLAQIGRAGPLTAATPGGFALTLGLLGLFVVVEGRVPAPLVPLQVLRSRMRAAANLGIALAIGVFAPLFLLLSLYLQQASGYTALATGLSFLPLALASLLASVLLGPRLVGRYGGRAALTLGMLLMAGACALLARLPVAAAFPVDLAPRDARAGRGPGHRLCVRHGRRARGGGGRRAGRGLGRAEHGDPDWRGRGHRAAGDGLGRCRPRAPGRRRDRERACCRRGGRGAGRRRGPAGLGRDAPGPDPPWGRRHVGGGSRYGRVAAPRAPDQEFSPRYR